MQVEGLTEPLAPRIIARQPGPADGAAGSISTAPPSFGPASKPVRLAMELREVLQRAAAAAIAIGEADAVAGLEAYVARSFAPLRGLLARCISFPMLPSVGNTRLKSNLY